MGLYSISDSKAESCWVLWADEARPSSSRLFKGLQNVLQTFIRKNIFSAVKLNISQYFTSSEWIITHNLTQNELKSSLLKICWPESCWCLPFLLINDHADRFIIYARLFSVWKGFGGLTYSTSRVFNLLIPTLPGVKVIYDRQMSFYSHEANTVLV